jgi:large subunit ribosomal protein L10
VKNRIVNIAFKEIGLPEVKDICCNQTAFAYGEDPVAIARFMVDFAKANQSMKVHGAMVEGVILDEAGAKDLAKSPTKEELKSQIVGQALGPGAQLAGALMGPASTIAGQIKSRVEELEKESA